MKEEVVVVKEEVVVVKEEVVVAMGFPVPGSELIVAAADVGPPIYKRSTAPEPMIGYPSLMGLSETLLDFDPVLAPSLPAPGRSTTWEWSLP